MANNKIRNDFPFQSGFFGEGIKFLAKLFEGIIFGFPIKRKTLGTECSGASFNRPLYILWQLFRCIYRRLLPYHT
jgi:hypothetical protein